jgi:hypothetical protein
VVAQGRERFREPRAVPAGAPVKEDGIVSGSNIDVAAISVANSVSCDRTISKKLGLQKLRPIFRGKLLRLLHGLCLSNLVELGRRRCPGRHGHTNLRKEFFLPGWSADAQ